MEKKPAFCPNKCPRLSPKEDGKDISVVHMCKLYKKRVMHGVYHPKLVMLKECFNDKYNKPKKDGRVL